jgi:signal transduction histidine kinase
VSGEPPSPLQRRGSLVRRLSLLALAWAALLLLVGAISLTALFRQTVMTDVDDRLAGVAEFLLASAEIDNGEGIVVEREPPDPRYEQVFSGRYWQIVDTADGEVMARSRSLWDELIEIDAGLAAQALGASGDPVSGAGEGPDGEPLRLLARAVRLPDMTAPVMIVAAEDSRPADRRVLNFALIAGALLGGFAILLAAGIVVQVRVGLDPVIRMGREVARVRDGDAERVTGAYPAELLPLATELNALLDHSRQVVERARTHVGNLAHALKTPITVLSNEARNATGPLAEMTRKQTAAMNAQVEHHLRRARAAANARAIGARTPVAPVLDDLGRTLRKIHARRRVQLDWKCEPDITFRGERQDLEELTGNLMDNACKWATSRIQVAARLNDAGRLEITVDDDGPGLDAAAREQALGRGVRLDERAPGDGFGLSIVSDLARAYGGDLILSESRLGGLGAKLVLPAGRAATGH